LKTLKTFLIVILLLVPGYAVAQVLGTIPIMAQGNHDAHDFSFSAPVPARASFYRVMFDTKDRLQGAQTLKVVVRRSLNGGLTDEPAGGRDFSSSVQPADFGAPLPLAGTDYRVLSGRITLYDGRWRGAAWIEFE
jgi:hypothetical protein